MHFILRNTLAVLAGIFVGGIVNMGIIQISGSIIPPPEGADLHTTEGLKAAMQIMLPRHFLMPFLAHALGVLFGAFLTVKLAVSHHLKLAMVVGFCFFFGGLSMILMLPSPLWFTVVDLVGAYFPMAFLAEKWAKKS
jgi:hypothetical protein